jgi:hypothetical protein
MGFSSKLIQNGRRGLRKSTEKPVISPPMCISLYLSQHHSFPPSPTSFKLSPSLHGLHSCFNTLSMRGSPGRYNWFYSLSMHGTARYTTYTPAITAALSGRKRRSTEGTLPPIGWTGSGQACRGRSLKNSPAAAPKLCHTDTPFTRPGLPALIPVLLSAVLSDVIIFSAQHNSAFSWISDVSTRLQQLILYCLQIYTVLRRL